jgi:anti-sigma-K factor RskA
MSDPIQSDVNPHREAEELLPWYATGQLQRDELRLIEKHLSTCAHCRRQLDFERRMVDEFASLAPEIDEGWRRLRNRLRTRENWWGKAARESAAVWRSFNRPAVAAVAFAQVTFLVIAGALLLSLSRPSYHALGSAPAPQSANLIVLFGPETTERQMRALLQANGASLVGGPTSTDAYLLRVPPQSRQAALTSLRSSRHVLLAAPIDGARA